MDQYLNFKIGYFQILHDGCFIHEGLIVDPLILSPKELRRVVAYSEYEGVSLYTLSEFIDSVFYPELVEAQTLCVGFNLPFDLSRLAQRYGNSIKQNRGGFTFYLTPDKRDPRIIIKKLGSSFGIKFSGARTREKEPFSGYFLDVQNLARVHLQNPHISLEIACILLNTKIRKMKDVEHGRITKRYIDYLITDVLATTEVYEKLIEELDHYQIEIPLTRISSAASLGKYALKQLGIKPFLEQNPDFPPGLLGNVVSAYYGGRTECRIRKTRTKVTVLDFTSMYPTVSMLLDLWRFLIADMIEFRDVTGEVRDLLSWVDLAYLQKNEHWKDFAVFVQIIPNEDILPVRMDYKGDRSGFNVGHNYLSSDIPLWYALPDVIASVLLTGKVPQIVQAIRFEAKGVQGCLKKAEILGIEIDPSRTSLFQVLVEERQRIKQEFENRAKALKILVNSMSYGIFIELNPEEKKRECTVHGLHSFTTNKNRFEKPGEFFHPIVRVLITAGSRLLLAMAETKVRELGGNHTYMDTDSIFVPPELAEDIIAYFQPLNPYFFDIPLLKVEKEDVWFYGISSKRYALFHEVDGSVQFLEDERSYKLHGLGHLLNPFSSKIEDWHSEIWEDILKRDNGDLTDEEIEEKYAHYFALSEWTISTPHVLNRVKVWNEGKSWGEMIKPFNFVMVGYPTIEENGKRVKPCLPFSKESQASVYEPFIDLETGEVKQGSRYFKNWSTIFSQYIDHPEYKFEGDVGFLERRHIHATYVEHIGKEANNIDDQVIGVEGPQVFVDEEEVARLCRALRPSEVERILGIDRTTVWRKKK